MIRMVLALTMGLAVSACAEKEATQPQASEPATASPPVAAVAVDAPAPQQAIASPARPVELPATLSNTESCALDAVNGQSVVDSANIVDKENVQFSGWAANESTGTTSETVFIKLEGPETIFIKAAPGIKRPDVAAHFGKPGMENSGWDANVNLSTVAAGNYNVWIIQVHSDIGLSCDSKRSVVLN